MQVTPTEIVLWTTAWTSLGWLANHRLTIFRDNAARLRGFRAFMAEWRSQVANAQSLPPRGIVGNGIADAFKSRIPEFHGWVESVGTGLRKRRGYREAVAELVSVTDLKTRNHQNHTRNVVLAAMDAVLERIPN